MKKSNLKYVGVALVALMAAACGNGADTIDRTQPNYVRKSELTAGSWYVMDTVVEVPSTTPITFTGYQGSMDKVRFEITEDMVVAYRTYEFIPGTDPLVDQEKSRLGRTVTLDGKPYKGAPYGAWRVLSHFDRVRDYNAATGEQTNVLVENMTDRPWYQREFMRVDWGTNMITNYNVADKSVSNWRSHHDRRDATGYYITPIDQEPGEDAIVFDYTKKGDKQELSYFDFTVKQYWQPAKMDYPGYGEIPYCWLNPRYDCEDAVVKSRYSFRKVDEARVLDYEPLYYTDKHQTKFGYFRTERITYDRNRGVTDSGRLLFADRHNIWKKSRYDDGSPIPMDKRDPNPIVYYVSNSYPQDLWPAAKGIAQSWNKAFRRAVAVPRGLSVDDQQIPDMFVLCHNPVTRQGADADPEICGEEGLSPRLGDIRYNILGYVADPMMAGPLGYGPHGADPETGEIIQAGAYMYGAALDTWAGDAQVVVDVLNGEISIDELTSGKNIRDFIAQNYQATDPRRPVTGPWSTQGPLVVQSSSVKDPSTFARLAPSIKGQVEKFVKDGHPPLMKEDRRKVVDSLIARNPAIEAELVDNPEIRAAVLAAAPGEKYRQKLLADPAFYRSVARQTMLRIGDLQKIEQARIDRASKSNIWLAEFSDDQFYGLAKKMKSVYDRQYNAYVAQQGKSAAEAKKLAKRDVYNQIRNSAFRGVAEHEVGHTIGLMHNFNGSFDALNYHDDYWRLRKETVGILDTTSGERVFPMQPQELVDAAKPNQKQIDEGIDEYAYSSIMDYGSRLNSDIQGIGKYDMAAILFVYSGGSTPGYVEVFNKTRADTEGVASYDNPNTTWPTTWVHQVDDGNGGTKNETYQMPVRGAHAEIPYRMARHYTPVSDLITDRFHYTTLPFMFADSTAADFNAALEQGVSRMQSRSFVKYEKLEPVYRAIENQFRDFLGRNGDFACTATACNSPDDLEETAVIMKPVLTQNGNRIPVEVPYMYCSDYEVGSSLSCNRWDRGADYYEMTEDWLSRYKDYYAFSHFKRDRYGFGPSGVFNRVYGRLLGNLPNVYQHWLFDIFWYADFYRRYYNDPTLDAAWMHTIGFSDPMFQNYHTMAVIDGVNTLLQTLSTPAAGYFAKTPDNGPNLGHWERVQYPGNVQDTRLSIETEQQFRAQLTASGKYVDLVYVERGNGKSMYTLFAHDGYDFFNRPIEVGHFWDQYAALNALTSDETNFLGVDRGSDALRYSLPYYITFPKELSRAVSGVWSENFGAISGVLNPTGGNKATYTAPTLVKGSDYISGFNYPVNSVIPTGTLANQVYPSPTWSTKFYGEIFGMAYFTAQFNQDFAMQNQVFKLGTGENITPTNGFEVVQFADPFGGGYTYAALKSTAASAEIPAAPFLVQRAIAEKATWDAAKLAAQAAPTDAVKQAAVPVAEQKLRETVRHLEMMRGLYGIFSQTW